MVKFLGEAEFKLTNCTSRDTVEVRSFEQKKAGLKKKKIYEYIAKAKLEYLLH